jgi:hypothetical protein
MIYKYYAITFAGTGRTSIMRQQVIGGRRVSLMRDDGTFREVGEIAEPFTATEVTGYRG